MKKGFYGKKELFACGKQKTLTGRNLDAVAFPLGGIGAGTVSLGGWGQLRDWEIKNRPAKGNTALNWSFFTIRVKEGKGAYRAKVLQGPPGGEFVMPSGGSAPNAAGEQLPHFRNVSFTGSYPFAKVALSDKTFPLKVTLKAFNPFIPLNDKDSSIPVAIMRYRIVNTGRKAVQGDIFGNLRNAVGDAPDGVGKGKINETRKENGMTGLWLTTGGYASESVRFGSMVLATDAKHADVCPRWKDEQLLKFWEMMTEMDALPAGGKDAPIGTVGVPFSLAAGAGATVTFVIAWYFPNFEWFYGPDVCDGDGCGCADTKKATWKNYYATVWSDAWDVAKYAIGDGERLYGETKEFHDALFATTLPSHVLDAVSSQMSILKTTTCLRLTDGTFYGFEGCAECAGCCCGSCTHVWNYAQALPYLFPDLQRSMRQADYTHAMREDGCVEFRVPLPLGTMPTWKFPAAADGQLGTVIQVYREWRIGGGDAWLKKMWPMTKKALEFAWKYWDKDKDGVMEGIQHQTYDVEFHGPNTHCGSLYLAALRAGEEMAKYLGEKEKAAEYRALFEKGSRWTDAHLFNGEYYEQKVLERGFDVVPEEWREPICAKGYDDKFPTWAKWQYGKGCLSDHLMGQWYARMVELGDLYDPKKIRKAARAIFRYNWKTEFHDHATLSAPRVYAANDEQGLLVCSWPKGGRPGYPSLYGDEVWTGIEYEVASLLIYEGFVKEGLSVVLGARKRYDGVRRNPWDEIECGHHYARAMSSYSVLLALSGCTYSAVEKKIGFSPRLFPDKFTTFYSVGSGWGIYRQTRGTKGLAAKIGVSRGQLELGKIVLGDIPKNAKKVRAVVSGAVVPARLLRDGDRTAVVLEKPVLIKQGEELSLTVAS